MFNVTCFGEILWDNFKKGKKAGGAPMNVALHLHKQGIGSRLISSIGKDRDGTALLQFLEQHHLPVNYIQQHPYLPTGLVEVELDEQQQATYTIKAPVAWDEIVYNDVLKRSVEESDALVFGSLASRNEVSRNTLLKLLPYAKVRVFDMNLRPPHFSQEVLVVLMQQCDLLKINEDELLFLRDLYQLKTTGEKDSLLKLSTILDIPYICLTLGSKGAMIINDGQIYVHPGFSVRVADTVGAGDAFLATCINNFLNGLSPDVILERACAAGALVASRPGANPDYRPDEIINHSFSKNMTF